MMSVHTAAKPSERSHVWPSWQWWLATATAMARKEKPKSARFVSSHSRPIRTRGSCSMSKNEPHVSGAFVPPPPLISSLPFEFEANAYECI